MPNTIQQRHTRGNTSNVTNTNNNDKTIYKFRERNIKK